MKQTFNIKALMVGFATIWIVSLLTGLGIAAAGLLNPSYSTRSTGPISVRLASFLFIGVLISRFCGGFAAGLIAVHNLIKNVLVLAIFDLVLTEAVGLFLARGEVLSMVTNDVAGFIAVLGGGCMAKLAK